MGKNIADLDYLELKGKIKNLDDNEKCQGRDLGSYRFGHYTTVDNAGKILLNKEFWCRKLSDMNDRDEASLHEGDKKEVFVLSFCCSNSEKIPMWYLYSGICGNGVNLSFTPGQMAIFINSIKEVLLFENDKSDKSMKLLEFGKDFRLSYGYVFYRKKVPDSSNNSDNVFYRNKWYHLTDTANKASEGKIMEEFEKGNYFVKNYPWEYEREFRIVITRELYKKP